MGQLCDAERRQSSKQPKKKSKEETTFTNNQEEFIPAKQLSQKDNQIKSELDLLQDAQTTTLGATSLVRISQEVEQRKSDLSGEEDCVDNLRKVWVTHFTKVRSILLKAMNINSSNIANLRTLNKWKDPVELEAQLNQMMSRLDDELPINKVVNLCRVISMKQILQEDLSKKGIGKTEKLDVLNRGLIYLSFVKLRKEIREQFESLKSIQENSAIPIVTSQQFSNNAYLSMLDEKDFLGYIYSVLRSF